MSNTASNYISKIDENYPVPGVDNNSQGFRSNFTNIKVALSSTNADIVGLQISSMQQFQDNDIGGYNLSNANLVNPSVTIAPQGDGTTPIDYSQAAFWPITLLNSGVNVVTIDNMPIGQKSGSLIVSVSSSSLYTQVLFTATTGTVVSLGPLTQPFDINTVVPTVFELWNDFTGDTPYIYVKKLTANIVDAAFTNALISSDAYYGNDATFGQSLTIGNNKFTTGTAYPSAGATVVTDSQNYGNIALVPNKITTLIGTDPIAIAGGASTEVSVVNPAGIQVGAHFYFSGTNTQYTVASVSGNIVNTVQTYSVIYSNPGDTITFINQQFTDTQAVVMQFSSIQAQDEFGSVSIGNDRNLKGTVYADSNNLQVTFDNPGNNNTNTFHISKLVENFTATNQQTTELANVGLVHQMVPAGAVIMWYGSSDNVPYGWIVCDGSTAPNGMVAPDLRDKFVIGAKSNYASGSNIVPATEITSVQTTFGGTATSVLVAHSHIATATTIVSADPGHAHLSAGPPSDSTNPNGPFTDFSVNGIGPNGAANWGFTESSQANAVEWYTSKSQGASVATYETTVNVASTGTTPGTYANLPPYIALWYIFKWVG